MPCSGFTGANLKETVDPKICPWYKYVFDKSSLTFTKEDQTKTTILLKEFNSLHERNLEYKINRDNL